jgi:hypothetical protein
MHVTPNVPAALPKWNRPAPIANNNAIGSSGRILTSLSRIRKKRIKDIVRFDEKQKRYGDFLFVCLFEVV